MSEDTFNPWSRIIGRAESSLDENGGPTDPFWQTEHGSVLRQQMDEVAKADRAQKERELAENAERNRIEREADQKVWAERRRVEAEEAAEQARVADQIKQANLAAVATNFERANAVREQALEALRAPDDDFHAICMTVSVYDDELADDASESEGDLSSADAGAASVWIDCFHSMGAIRADGLRTHLMGGIPASDDGAAFYLVFRSEAAEDVLAKMERFGGSDEYPFGAYCTYESVNATRLYAALTDVGSEIARFGGDPRKELSPEPDEPRSEWLDRIALSATTLGGILERWELSGGNPDLFTMVSGPDECPAGGEKIDWIVPGVLARKCVHLLVAEGGAGKSSLVQSWAAALTGQSVGRERSVLGIQISKRFVVALAFAEDPAARMHQRSAKQAKIWGAQRYFLINGKLKSFEEILHLLESAEQIDLIIFDPMRRFLEGDEDNSGVVSAFFNRLERIAEIKNCAVLVVHHLKRGRAHSLSQMLNLIRGSTVISQRPRLILGLRKPGQGVVEIGVIKHNFDDEDLWSPENVGVRFQVDQETSTLVSIGSPSSSAPSGQLLQVSPDVVCGAVRSLNQRGIVVRRTGQAGLYAMRLPQLSSMSRSSIAEMIQDLLAAGTLTDGPDGLQLSPSASEAG